MSLYIDDLSAKPIPGAKPQAVDKVILKLLPEVCISDKPQGICYEKIRVWWQSPAKISACLFILGKKGALACWRGTEVGEHFVKIHSNRTLSFVLKAVNSQQVFAEKNLSVLKVKRKSRRRRHAWSIF